MLQFLAAAAIIVRGGSIQGGILPVIKLLLPSTTSRTRCEGRRGCFSPRTATGRVWEWRHPVELGSAEVEVRARTSDEFGGGLRTVLLCELTGGKKK